MKKRNIVIAGLIIIIGCISFKLYMKNKKTLKESDFEMIKVEKGDVVHEITATGKIQPINTITVGTQVSGIISKVLTDYNEEVKEGQLLAEIDTAILIETRNEAKANIDLAFAEEKIAKLNFDRVEKLYKDKLTSKSAFEEQELQLKKKHANTLIAQANFNKAQQNYDYAFITSPVSGTIISKEIEQGQTVAASLSAPILFEIAEDLSKMQIEASIAEADIGYIKQNMNVTFTVDAYPNDIFNGFVRQIRLSPTEDNNVVMYTVVIDANNDSKKLLPGMTASVTLKVEEVKNTIRISSSALQYKPTAEMKAKMGIIDNLKDNQDIVYMFKDKKIVPVIITKGLIDITYIEIIDGLKEGDKVVGEYIGGKKK